MSYVTVTFTVSCWLPASIGVDAAATWSKAVGERISGADWLGGSSTIDRTAPSSTPAASAICFA
jgi:hypothetical protein